MLMFAQIGLTVWAWRRGWKGWALVPLGLGLLAAAVIGFSTGASGGSVDDIAGVLLFLDLACIGALIGLVARPRVSTTHKVAQSSQVLQSTEG